jgi:hypothetical protein
MGAPDCSGINQRKPACAYKGNIARGITFHGSHGFQSSPLPDEEADEERLHYGPARPLRRNTFSKTELGAAVAVLNLLSICFDLVLDEFVSKVATR